VRSVDYPEHRQCPFLKAISARKSKNPEAGIIKMKTSCKVM